MLLCTSKEISLDYHHPEVNPHLLFKHWIKDHNDTEPHDCFNPGGLPKNLRAPKRLIHVGDLDQANLLSRLTTLQANAKKRSTPSYRILGVIGLSTHLII
jgi:hypothetical protein